MSPASSRQPAVTLDPARVHAWRVERQLLGGVRAGSPVDVAAALVGVQAQVTSAAALAVALRSRHARGRPGHVDATTQALLDRRLVRSWAMRGTLHLIAADDLPTVAAALRGREMWRRPAWLRWFGVTEPEMETLIHAVGDVLDDGRPRTRAELAEELGERLGRHLGKLLLGSWGAVLKIAGEYGYVCQSAETESGVRFVRPRRWLGTWREEDPETALSGLVDRYLGAYGPATLKEISRWWGVATLAALRPAIAALGDGVAEVDVGGRRAYLRTADVAAIEATKPKREDVHLVGPFDPLIVAAGLREQLLPPAHLKRVSRTAGWISPVVLVDGVAAGVWDSSRTAETLVVTVEPFAEPSAALRSAIGKAAERVGAAQGAAVSVRYGRVFERKAPSGAP